ncbi:MAG: hypothetical protein ACUVTL_07100 [Thermoproteota archaeon]
MGLLILLFIPVAVMVIFLIQALPPLPSRTMTPSTDPNLFFFAFVFLPFLIAAVLCVIMTVKTSKIPPS